MKVLCPECDAQETLVAERWRCDCGGAWEPVEPTGLSVAQIDTADFTIWRYRRFLGLEKPTVQLGVGWTPLLPQTWDGREVRFKLEFMAPTGSFKDRGTEVMINILAAQGETYIVDDSSGNAGASVAAYAAQAGMRAEIFVPAYASPAKQAQIAVYGAEVRPIPGVRGNAKAGCPGGGRRRCGAGLACLPSWISGRAVIGCLGAVGTTGPPRARLVRGTGGPGGAPAGRLARLPSAEGGGAGAKAPAAGRRPGVSAGSTLPCV